MAGLGRYRALSRCPGRGGRSSRRRARLAADRHVHPGDRAAGARGDRLVRATPGRVRRRVRPGQRARRRRARAGSWTALGQPRVLRAAAAVPRRSRVAGARGGGRASARPAWAARAVRRGAAAPALPQVPAAMRSLWGTLVERPGAAPDRLRARGDRLRGGGRDGAGDRGRHRAVASPEAAVRRGRAGGRWGARLRRDGGSRGWRGERSQAGWLGPLAAPGMRRCSSCSPRSAPRWACSSALPRVRRRARAPRRGRPAARRAVGRQPAGGARSTASRPWPGSLDAAPAWRCCCARRRLRAAGRRRVATRRWRVLLVLAGSLVAPVAVVGSTLLDTVAPLGTATEAFAVMIMGIVAGSAAGNALAGAVRRRRDLRCRGARAPRAWPPSAPRSTVARRHSLRSARRAPDPSRTSSSVVVAWWESLLATLPSAKRRSRAVAARADRDHLGTGLLGDLGSACPPRRPPGRGARRRSRPPRTGAPRARPRPRPRRAGSPIRPWR